MKGLFVTVLAVLCLQMVVGNPRFVRDTDSVTTTEPATTEATSIVEPADIISPWSDLDTESKIDSLGAKGLNILEQNLDALKASFALNDYGMVDGAFIPKLPKLLHEKAGLEY